MTTTTTTVKHLSVTADDIAKGKRGSASWCPIALAVRREFPDATSVVVDYYSAVASGPGYSCRTTLPRPARDFIGAYDDDRRLFRFYGPRLARPFEIDLPFNCTSYAPAEPPTEQDIDKFEQAIGNDAGDAVTGKTAAEIDAGDPGPDPDAKDSDEGGAAAPAHS